jgi:hypothetical protein
MGSEDGQTGELDAGLPHQHPILGDHPGHGDRGAVYPLGYPAGPARKPLQQLRQILLGGGRVGVLPRESVGELEDEGAAKLSRRQQQFGPGYSRHKWR